LSAIADLMMVFMHADWMGLTVAPFSYATLYLGKRIQR
jgi:hypothetical protein